MIPQLAPPPSPDVMMKEGDNEVVILEAIRHLNENPQNLVNIKLVRMKLLGCPKPPAYDVLNVAKRSLSVNLISICLILALLPLTYVDIYVFVNNVNCDDPFLKPFFYFLAVIALVSVVSLPKLIKKRLSMF